MSVLDLYQAAVDRGDLSPDPAQARGAQALHSLAGALTASRTFSWFKKKAPPKGLYLHGGVGRGKSMLMDLFFGVIEKDIPARRVHFHEFMIETHDWLHARRKERLSDLMPRYAADVAKRVRLLCFDEFHVTDVADAMILSRLFTALFEKGVVVVATSNWPPERLYEGGLQRDLFLPFIDLIQRRMDVIHLDHGIDYRRATVGASAGGRYYYPLGYAANKWADEVFFRLSGGDRTQMVTVTVKGRDIPVLSAGRVARISFSDMCERPRAAEDYLHIADMFDSFVFEGIPKMGYDRRNETKRLMLLIDVLYDRKKDVYMTADAAPEKLYFGHDYAFEFDRTVSRLKEMANR